MSFRLTLSVDEAAGLFVLLAGLLVPVLSKLELKSEFVCLIRAGLLMVEGISFIGLPSIKLFALADQSWSPPHVVQIANALKDKLAPITIMDTKTRRITDFVITSPYRSSDFGQSSSYLSVHSNEDFLRLLPPAIHIQLYLLYA